MVAIYMAYIIPVQVATKYRYTQARTNLITSHVRCPTCMASIVHGIGIEDTKQNLIHIHLAKTFHTLTQLTLP